MINKKRARFKKAIEAMKQEDFGDKDLLSSDLPQRIPSLSQMEKVTIRLSQKVLSEARKEAKERGIGYQTLLNDLLLKAFDLKTNQKAQEEQVLKQIQDQIGKINRRLAKLEKGA